MYVHFVLPSQIPTTYHLAAAEGEEKDKQPAMEEP